ncbi:MAG TPA: trimethylamine methyltransferase family protein [Gaiellales bacterium]|nr:trimethylamine methyltransferase family protein [Gaiellales bacterium]
MEQSDAATTQGFVHRLPPVELLSEDAMALLETGWRRLASEVGVRFNHPVAQELFRGAGQEVDDEGVVRLDPDFVLEAIAAAPRCFTLRARNPERSVVIGGDHLMVSNLAGPPFVLEDGVRRDATMHDLERFLMLAHVYDVIDSQGCLPCEPTDLPLDSRHLDIQVAALTLSDKPHMGALFDGAKVRDGLALAEIVFGGADALEEGPVTYGVANVNSPLAFDTPMIEVIMTLAERNQAVIVTPFLLMGAMSPVALPAALVQQTVESLAGAVLAQLVRPGAPVVLGSFLSHTDMQSGSPGFGGPESAIGLLCSGQLARRFGLPWRAGGGGLTSSPRPDAQAAYEALTTHRAAFASGANVVLHGMGWLESGLVASFEKAVIDVEMLEALRVEFTPIEVDEASLAFDAHLEVGHGGHFFGAAHTLDRFRECFHRPLLASTSSYERWKSQGSLDAAARADRLWREALDRYEAPPLPAGVEEEMAEFVTRRRRELGA